MGSKVETFEDLEIWQLARLLTKDLSKIFYNPKFHNYSFQDQIMRASISICNNIAEGFERKGDKEFSHFLFIAKGSCGEVRSMLYTAVDLSYLTNETMLNLIDASKLISKKLSSLIKYLKK